MSRLSQLLNGASLGALPGLLALAAIGGLAVGQANAATPGPKIQAIGPAHSEGTINLSVLGAAAARSSTAAKSGPQSAASKDASEYRNIGLHSFRPQHTFTQAEAAVGAPHATAVGHLVNGNGKALPPGPRLGNSFNGLDHADQRNADNGNQFSLEPPDQGLAVGHGYVVESVNNALQVYTTAGKPLLAAPVSMNKFFNQPSEFNRTTGERGPFLSDTRAYYDYATGRFFVTEWATLNDANGNPLNVSIQFFAVSQTSNPTGAWNLFSYETTNPQFAGCPCFPDFNQLGMDASSVTITNNLFGIGTNAFVGAVLYIFPKQAVEAGTLPILFETSTPLSNDFTIMPTVIPPHANFASENNGTEYLVENGSDLSNNGIGTSVNIWAITNTKSLKGSNPSLGLSFLTLPTQTVSANLPPVLQMDGSRPLGGSGPGGLNDPNPMLNPDDGRFSSTAYYVNGVISAASSTAVVQPDNSVSDGVAFYQFNVSGGDGGFTASVKNQAIYAAPNNGFLAYPAVAMNVFGEGGIGVTVSSLNMFPSTASISVPEFASPAIVLSGIGAQPDDGFTAYAQFGGNGVGRWGDYGAGAVDAYGSLWFGNEYIPDSAVYPRTSLANWGTYISRTAP
ncbi:MAG: hypothetical protein ABI306_00845 [Caulobacteraceae bacterium]